MVVNGPQRARDPRLLEPRRPHDACTFEELQQRYNFEKTSDRRIVFTRLVLDEIAGRAAPVRVLDIGCGSGMGRSPDFIWAIREQVDELWGVEPDTGVLIEEGLFDRVERDSLEEAALPEDYFDVAFAYMVVEHIPDPVAFCSALSKTLKPGGVFVFITPNGRHYFTRLASLAHRLHVDEFTLRLLRGAHAKHGYHHAIAYQFNRTADIDAALVGLNFDRPEYAYIERLGPAPYLRGALRPVLWLGVQKRRLIKKQDLLLHMVGRIQKRQK